MDLMKLQNGSDVRGVAVEGVKGEDVNLTNEIVYKIAYAFCFFLKQKLGKENLVVSLGRDSRISGEDLAQGIIKGLNAAGAKVVYFDYSTTPAMFLSCIKKEVDADGAIMISASHLPFNRNGMKFFTKGGGLEKTDIKELLMIAKGVEVDDSVKANYETLDFLSIYAKDLVKKIKEETGSEKPFENTKIIVDAGNGMGGFFVNLVLDKLGADTSGSVYLDPDGYFPNHVPNPELMEVMDNFAKLVTSEKADLGIIFDTDVDRAAVVDGSGEEICRNKLVALMASICLEECLGSYIVTDSVTSAELKEFIEAKGGVHHRFKRGYKNVINEGIRLNEEGKDCLLAIETSGHCALKENYFLDDGAYMIVKILSAFARQRKQGKSVSSLIKDLKEPLEAIELRAKFNLSDFKEYGENILLDFKKYVEEEEGYSFEVPNYEGVRAIVNKNGIKGWVLLRMSLHDPVMPINIESSNEGGADIIKKDIVKFLSNYEVSI